MTKQASTFEKIKIRSIEERRKTLSEGCRMVESHHFTIGEICEDLKDNSYDLDLFKSFKINNICISDYESEFLAKTKLADIILNMHDDLGNVILSSEELDRQVKNVEKWKEKKQQLQNEREELHFWHYEVLGGEDAGQAHHYLYDGPYKKLKEASKDIQNFVNEMKTTGESEKGFEKLCEAASFLKELLNQ